MPSRRKLCQSLIDPTANIRRELRPLTGTFGRESNRRHAGQEYRTLRYSCPVRRNCALIILNTASDLSAPGRQWVRDPRRRDLGDREGASAGSASLSAPILRSAASAARSPLSQAPSTVPHRVSWVASPARNMQPIGSDNILREGCPPGIAADIAPSTNGAAFQRVALDFLTADAASLPNSFPSHSTAKPVIAFSPCAERSRPNEPATSIEHKDDDPILANRSAVRVVLLCSMMISSRASPSGLPGNCSAMWS